MDGTLAATRGLRLYLSLLGVLALAVLGWLLTVGAAQVWTPVVVPVVALVCVGHLCPLWASVSRLRPQWLDASDVGLVVAVVLLPLPVALLVHVLASLLSVLVEFRRSSVRVLYNSAHVVLTAAATGALLSWWDPPSAWLPWAAAGACFLVEQVVAQPMLLVVTALARGSRPAWGELGPDRPAATLTVPLATAALAGAVGAAVQLVGGVLAWPALALLGALAVVSRARVRAQLEVQRLVHVVRVLSSSAAGRGTSPVLATLDAAMAHVGGVGGVRVALAGDLPPPGWLSQGVPSEREAGLRLLVRRPVETITVGGSREDAVRALLRTGAQAYAMAESTSALRHDVHHDALTGLLNRAGFLARADLELARARRSHLSAVLVYVDLDGFKAVNDSLGHEAGDRALQATGVELRELVRPHDVVARLAGDEFVLLLLDLPTCEQGGAVVDRVRERMASGWPVVPGSRLRLRGSVGTACFPTEGEDVAALLRHADEQMYLRKRGRR